MQHNKRTFLTMVIVTTLYGQNVANKECINIPYLNVMEYEQKLQYITVLLVEVELQLLYNNLYLYFIIVMTQRHNVYKVRSFF